MFESSAESMGRLPPEDSSRLSLSAPSETEPAEIPPEPLPPTLPRPGLGLAVLIVLGIPFVHLVTTVLFVMAAAPELAMQAGSASLVDRLSSDKLIQLLAFDQGMFVLMAFLGTWLAFGRRFPQVIPGPLPALRHLTLIFLLVLPLAVMDGFLAQQVIDIGEQAFGHSPSQGELPELLDGISRDASLELLLLILAVMPALGEELVFRGVIGRGLIARKGIVLGIFWTSVLFSVVHGNPVQGVGVFFVGVMCHVSYLATRSLLAPILLHFLNNTLPVIALKSMALQQDQAASGMEMNPFIALAAMICVAALGCLLWKSRVEYLDGDGLVIAEDIPSVEAPPEAEFRRCRPVAGAWVVWSVVAYLLFLASGSLVMPV